MRVIAGRFKGRILDNPQGVKMRPTSQKVKEALFDILGSQIYDSSFLELFAGSGSIGLEALSRGAKKVVFVENNRLCLKTIKENLTRLKLLYNYAGKPRNTKERFSLTILPWDSEKAIQRLWQEGEKFNFVFLDPPYYENQLKNSLIKICRYDILKPHSLVIAEHNKKETLAQLPLILKVTFTRRYGDTVLSFFQLRPRR